MPDLIFGSNIYKNVIRVRCIGVDGNTYSFVDEDQLRTPSAAFISFTPGSGGGVLTVDSAKVPTHILPVASVVSVTEV